jgi:hypothetical protein
MFKKEKGGGEVARGQAQRPLLQESGKIVERGAKREENKKKFFFHFEMHKNYVDVTVKRDETTLR